MFWIPDLQPEAVLLTMAREATDGAAVPIDLTRLDGLDLRHADDGWHAIWHADGVTHQFWLVDAPADTTALYIAHLPFDSLFELRAHAARRFWRAINGRSPGRAFRAMPDQLRRFHIYSMRALDARDQGESYRAIAEVLLGFRGDKTDWESDPRKNQARRLVANGLRMMRGGYRALLHYPIKLRRH